jgi:hypothetical protein
MQQHTLWMSVRLVESRLMFLDASGNWDDLGPATLVSPDRELVFQTGRKVGGLLLRADGLPCPDSLEEHRTNCFQAFGVNVGAAA